MNGTLTVGSGDSGRVILDVRERGVVGRHVYVRRTGWEMRMNRAVPISMLKRRLDVLLARDVSAMGYEAKMRHRQRVESARGAYEAAIENARKSHVKSPVAP